MPCRTQPALCLGPLEVTSLDALYIVCVGPPGPAAQSQHATRYSWDKALDVWIGGSQISAGKRGLGRELLLICIPNPLTCGRSQHKPGQLQRPTCPVFRGEPCCHTSVQSSGVEGFSMLLLLLNERAAVSLTPAAVAATLHLLEQHQPLACPTAAAAS